MSNKYNISTMLITKVKGEYGRSGSIIRLVYRSSGTTLSLPVLLSLTTLVHVMIFRYWNTDDNDASAYDINLYSTEPVLLIQYAL